MRDQTHPIINMPDELRDFGGWDASDTPYHLQRRDALMRSLPGRLQAGNRDAGMHSLPDRDAWWVAPLTVVFVIALVIGTCVWMQQLGLGS